ncbi:Trihelix transcription factor GT-2 [Mucuna pruriens]|uniref:Trihelix transcription factor GT-2 n=1 Tax=Mucuna pruriens TaxID=157652 RepID=A0A371EMQ7_MUCPR|nr:Trihelix transcription factor GT-2 [Mucuna pruriens]
MLEISTSPETPVENPEGGAVAVLDGSKGEHGEEGDRNSAANRWPREETMALLKIRSEMDVAFKDTNPKAPLWEQVSRKLAVLGYHRNAKKCKEKFENIYKYHRRTKEGRCGKGKSNGSKNYRFFEQLEALDGQQAVEAVPCSVSAHVAEHSSSTTSCSGSKKSKLMSKFLEGLMKEVIEKQETLQRKFMEVLDKCERDRMAREEAWKEEELARIQKERQLLAQERSIAAAKDEAVLAFLRKFAEAEGTVHLFDKFHVQNNKHMDMQETSNANVIANENGDIPDMDKQECGNVSVGNLVHMSTSRWPKEEVEALIRLRTQLDVQSQGNVGSKGPLWEEISSAMKSLGYDRSAKRCKEKWENINKYFKRMKEKNKRKPQDSKTCPYYHTLEALYSKRPKKMDESGENNSGNELKPEELLMHIMESQEERQQQQIETQSSSEDADAEREDTDQNQGDNQDQTGYQMVHNSPSIAIMS